MFGLVFREEKCQESVLIRTVSYGKRREVDGLIMRNAKNEKQLRKNESAAQP